MLKAVPAMSDTEQPFLPTWARYIILPGVVGPALILGFIFVNETAHNETRCPYVQGQPRSLGRGVQVREDTRNCLWDVQDHRFSVIRGDAQRVLGHRRFRAEAFAPGRYVWNAELSDEDEVQLVVKNEGHGEARFREGKPSERSANE